LVQAEESLDKEKAEERRKKFGNTEAGISLDDEIKKSKHIKKGGKHHNFHHGHRQHRRW
jgi:hypothetical protein